MGYADALGTIARLGFGFAKKVWTETQPSSRMSLTEVYRVPPDYGRSAAVDLDAAAQDWIGGLEAVHLGEAGLGFLDVEIEHRARGSDDGPVIVYVADRRVGIVSAADVALFQPALRDAEEVRQKLSLPAVRSRAASGVWRLHVVLPEERE